MSFTIDHLKYTTQDYFLLKHFTYFDTPINQYNIQQIMHYSTLTFNYNKQNKTTTKTQKKIKDATQI